jgi:hypothetical protein
MQKFKVYENQDGKIELVKQGWSWPAFFFTGIWLLVKKMWVLGSLYWVLLLLVEFLKDYYYLRGWKEFSTIGRSVYSVIPFILGAMGNMIREKNLLSRDFDFKKTITGLDQEDAAASLHERG